MTMNRDKLVERLLNWKGTTYLYGGEEVDVKALVSILDEWEKEWSSREEIYKTALDKLSRLGNEPFLGNSIGNCMAQDALRDAAALSPEPVVPEKPVAITDLEEGKEYKIVITRSLYRSDGNLWVDSYGLSPQRMIEDGAQFFAVEE